MKRMHGELQDFLGPLFQLPIHVTMYILIYLRFVFVPGEFNACVYLRYILLLLILPEIYSYINDCVVFLISLEMVYILLEIRVVLNYSLSSFEIEFDKFDSIYYQSQVRIIYLLP